MASMNQWWVMFTEWELFHIFKKHTSVSYRFTFSGLFFNLTSAGKHGGAWFNWLARVVYRDTNGYFDDMSVSTCYECANIALIQWFILSSAPYTVFAYYIYTCICRWMIDDTICISITFFLCFVRKLFFCRKSHYPDKYTP